MTVFVVITTLFLDLDDRPYHTFYDHDDLLPIIVLVGAHYLQYRWALIKMSVLLETSLGDIVVDLYIEERPKCSINFLKLCKIKYYNYVLFHSVQRNSLAQSGDPTGTGEGGRSIWGEIKGDDYRYFTVEVTPRLKHLKTGTLSMVNNGNDSHTSQFFITLSEGLSHLDGKHTVFGEVAEGLDVLMKISEAYCDNDGRPYQDIRIYHTVVLEDPFDDPEGM